MLTIHLDGNIMPGKHPLGCGREKMTNLTMPALRVGMIVLAAAASNCLAQSFTTLYTFSGGADGGYPQYGRLIGDANGNLYGTATFGGDVSCPLVTYPGPGCGVVFKLAPSTKTETVLYTFTDSADGAQPWGGVIRDQVGNLYGTAAFGGSYGGGVIFKLDPSGNQTVLHAFDYTGGAIPTGDLAGDAAGALYGTTVTGGFLSICRDAGCGVVFKEEPVSGEFTLLHRFEGLGGTDGANPTHGLISDGAGNIYGTTENGGIADCDNSEPYEAVETYVGGCGEVFELNNSGQALLYGFGLPPDGSDPRGGVVRDAAGNLYGTTFYGGLYGAGTIFKLDTTGHETVLYNFQGSSDGASPSGGLVEDSEGNLFGIANHAGGPCGCGTVFKLDPQGNYTVLHTFTGADGQFPEAPLLLYGGKLYGTTSSGGTLSDGSRGTGTIFEITP